VNNQYRLSLLTKGILSVVFS